jgi:hypothetical protein
MGSTTRWGIVVAAAAGLWLGSSQAAQACGGFFCDNAAPVNQAAERIIFAKNPDDTVTAVIQILYQGPAEGFSWVLPVPGTPEVQVSSDAAFQRLQWATNPQYRLDTRVEGTCAERDDVFFGPPNAGSGADAGAAVPDEDLLEPGVHVVDQGHVGPYDYVVISLDAGHEHPGDAAVDWLQDNGYDVDDFGRDRLGPYLADGLNLIAFRLTKNRDAGSIRPIRLTYPQGAPVIPIRPTAVAANDDMGVLVWVLGPSRAVPINYLALELNEALINWFNPMSTYDEVVSAAADEAGGHGFVTEMSGATSGMSSVVFSWTDRSEWTDISNTDWSGAHGELIWRTGTNYGTWDGFLDVFARHVPVPEGVDEDEFLACPNCYLSFDDTEIQGFNPEAYVQDLEDEVVEPMAQTQELIDGAPHLTRLYSTLSAHEMTLDPLFDFNPDLDDVSNVHSATRVIECSEAVTQWEAPWRVELASGDVVRGEGTTWPIDWQWSGMPLNRRILDMTTRGEGSLVVDNAASIEAALAEHNATVPPPPVARGGGCAVGGLPAQGPWAALVAALALLVVLRRRSFP